MFDGIAWLRNAAIYQKDYKVLSEVNLTINPGGFAYVIGKTGSGKTSLLKTLYGALPLKSGSGEVAGFDLNTLDRKNIPLLRRKLGIIFQDFNLLMDRTVADNLYFVLYATGWTDKTEMEMRVKSVLENVGLLKKYQSMPHELSGGEQQRVVIARALLNNPVLILADEPTGNLDPETSDEIMNSIKEIAHRNRTAVLFATHDYRLIDRYPGRIIRCLKGRVIDEGNLVL